MALLLGDPLRGPPVAPGSEVSVQGAGETRPVGVRRVLPPPQGRSLEWDEQRGGFAGPSPFARAKKSLRRKWTQVIECPVDLRFLSVTEFTLPETHSEFNHHFFFTAGKGRWHQSSPFPPPEERGCLVKFPVGSFTRPCRLKSELGAGGSHL